MSYTRTPRFAPGSLMSAAATATLLLAPVEPVVRKPQRGCNGHFRVLGSSV